MITSIHSMFDTSDRCAASQPVGQWVFYPLGVCYGGTGGSYFYGGCDERSYTISTYTDEECTVWKANIQQPSPVCVLDDGTDDSVDFTNFITLQCSA
jgi:hypothetical protein